MYNLSYTAPSSDDTDPYPTAGQCASPYGIPTCLTDGQIQAEIDKLAGVQRGLNNLWIVFLPQNVDECINANLCGTDSFSGYHGVLDLNGDGPTVYPVVIDPQIEHAAIAPGADPEGQRFGEAAVSVAAHETAEAITDPEGTGWYDPNGNEVGDKCQNGSQTGGELGRAGPDHAPYNQVIHGDDYLIQEMWSNDDGGCVQNTTRTNSPLPLPQVNLTQFNSTVIGNINKPLANVGVTVSLLRGSADVPIPVAQASRITNPDGSWSVSLPSHAVGDDRDEIDVDYTVAPGQPNSAPIPNHQVILSGNGGNVFNASGWTGWFDLDNGSAISGTSLTLGLASRPVCWPQTDPQLRRSTPVTHRRTRHPSRSPRRPA